MVDRALALGARHIDVGQLPEEGHVVLADPEGNEFCVIPAGNDFLAECGFIGALSSDGLQAVGYFWSEVLGWPLVWDQDEETAIRSTRRRARHQSGAAHPCGRRRAGTGGTTTWPPRTVTTSTPRSERLLSLGATRVGAGHDGSGGARRPRR